MNIEIVLYLETLEGNPVRALVPRPDGKLAGERSYPVDEVTVTKVAYGWKDIQALISNLERANGA